MNVDFHPEGFVKQLQYMGLGMLAIIIVMGAIILVTMLLNRVTGSKTSSTAKKGVAIGGVIVAIALMVVLVLTDGSCAICRKNGEHELEGKKYCDEHYEEVWKEFFEEHVDELKR